MAKSVMKPRRKAKLPQAPNLKPRRHRTLIVVADGAKARFLRESEDHRALVPAEGADMLAPRARRPNRDLVTDKPGRGFSTARDRRRGAFEPPHDFHKLEKHNFTARLAEHLDEVCAARRFDRVVLVAPSRSLGELRTLLSARVRKAVSHEVAKDLTASSGRALRKAGGIPLKPLIARGLTMGDEMHQRNVACSSLLLRQLAPALAQSTGSSGATSTDWPPTRADGAPPPGWRSPNCRTPSSSACAGTWAAASSPARPRRSSTP